MILALISLAKMLKRRASKRFVLVEAHEEPQHAAGNSNNANNDSGTINNNIPNIVAIEHDDVDTDYGSSSSNNNNISNMHDNNFNNNNMKSSLATTTTGNLLSVTPAGTLK